MGYVIKLGPRVVAVVDSGEAVVDPLVAVLLEPCLLAYKGTVVLGDMRRVHGLSGYRVIFDSADKAAKAIQLCIAHVLHRIPKVEVTKYYELRPPSTVKTSSVKSSEAPDTGTGGIEFEE